MSRRYRKRAVRRSQATRLALIAVISAAGLGVATLAARAPVAGPRADSVQHVTDCRVIDGDTLRCGGERVRLLGIDAPEKPGSCRPGRICAPGNFVEATASLRTAVAPRMRIERVGQDRYGRTLALVDGPRGNLSCWQLNQGQAVYRDDWDDGGAIARSCPTLIHR